MTTASTDSGAGLRVAIEAALLAGDYFKSRFATELVVKTKTSLADVVTDVDPYCERLIRQHIAKHFPDHSVLGEEQVAPGRAAAVAATQEIAECEAVWIVDPLDGTTNYVSAIPLSVVSIAFAAAGRLQLGVIYDPYREEVFYGVAGQGAHLARRADVVAWLAKDGAVDALPGMSLQVSQVRELARAVIATGLPMRHQERAKMMQKTAQIIAEAKSLRTLGAAALHLAYLAAGRIDMFWEYELNAWDVAAGVLLIQEAGGYIGSLDGSDYSLLTRNIVATSEPTAANQIRRMLNE